LQRHKQQTPRPGAASQPLPLRHAAPALLVARGRDFPMERHATSKTSDDRYATLHQPSSSWPAGGFPMERHSTSKTSVLLAGIVGGMPASPYAFS
jgi:hypothetical protein